MSCSGENRKGLGEIGYAVEGTRVDMAHGRSRLARYTDRWNEWADREYIHQMGYAKGTADYTLKLTNCGQNWISFALIFIIKNLDCSLLS